MLKMTGNSGVKLEITIDGEKYLIASSYNPTSGIVYEVEEKEDIVFGSTGALHIHVRTNNTIEFWEKDDLELTIPYKYQKARKEIISDLKKQIDAFSENNYFSNQKLPEEMREKFRDKYIIKGMRERIEKL